MILTKTIHLNVTQEAASTLWYISRGCNRVYNAMVEDRQMARKEERKVGYFSQKKLLPALKSNDLRLKDPCSQTLQEVAKVLDSNYKSFFEKFRNGDTAARPPGFRSGNNFFTQHYPQRYNSFKITNTELKIAFGKSKKDWLSFEIPDGDYSQIKTVKIGFDDMSKRFCAWMTVEVEEAPPKKDGYLVYFDPGCKMTLTGITSGGKLVEYDINPLRKINMDSYKLLDKLISRRDLKVKGSNAWRRLNKRVKAMWRKIATRTKTYLHSLANQILLKHTNAKGFMVGDWKKQETLADTGITFVNRRINRAVQNNNPVRKLIEMLSYKAQLRNGQSVGEFDERGTTRTCVACDHVHEKGIDPSIRVFRCESCGFSYQRDHHSCLNFLKRFESAAWRGLRENLPVRSIRTTLTPSSCKPQRTDILFSQSISTTGCTVSI